MDCEVAREALSARLDDEREPVPSARVDEHLGECAACRAWFEQVADQVDMLRRLVQSRPVITPLGPFGPEQDPVRRRGGMNWQRWALLGVGLAQVILAIAQGLGLSVGLAHQHGTSAGNHLLNESTSWSVALAVAMIGAAIWPRAATGLAGVLTVFAGVLTVHVVVDSLSGTVTAMRILTHIPVVIGAVLAILVWRSSDPPQPLPAKVAAEPDIVLPQNASRGRRRGHLWPTDGSAA
jgi:predicted anti-sigma-YlaC factor YlaD